MTNSKHGWNTQQNYFELHERYLKNYSYYMVEPVHTYEYDRTTKTIMSLEASFVFKTNKDNLVKIVIRKRALFDLKRPNWPMVRTKSYTYTAICTKTNKYLLRYCSPHEHRKYHHVHKTIGKKKHIITLNIEDVPHVSEFFDEVLRNL